MRDQRTPAPSEDDGQLDHAILLLLLDSQAQRPWAVDELARETGANVTDAVGRLFGAGLIHCLDSFVWATRAALAADELGF